MLDQTGQPFLVVDLDGRFLRFNQAFAELIGYSAEELRAMDLRDVSPERWRPTTQGAMDRLRAGEEAQRYEKEYVRRDGRVIPVEVVADVIRDAAGSALGYFAFITDISERRRAERALRESEERFRRLYDEAPFGYHEIDAAGVVLNVNRTECEMLGYAREEMIGRPVFDFLALAQREEGRRAVAERIRGERPITSAERIYLTKDGRELDVLVENRLIRDERGRVVGLRSTLQDISRRKQAEAALLASERRARALFEGIDDAVFVHDLDGRILDANPAASRRLGYTHEEFLRLNTRDIDDPEFAAGYAGRLEQQLRTGHLHCQGRHRTKDGRSIPVDINTSTLTLEGRRVVLAVIRDNSEREALEDARRQVEETRLRAARVIGAKNRELTRSEARYRQLAEGSLDAIVVADAEGRITLFNPAAERTFGYAAGEVLGRPLATLIPEDLPGDPPLKLDRALQGRDPRVVGRTVELSGRRKGGEVFPLELSLSAVDIGGEIQFLGSIRDLAERHRMRAMLMQSEKLASIGLLSAGVAHEINNPLAFIANNLAVLERDLGGILRLVAAYESARGPIADAAPEALAEVRAAEEELDWAYVRDNLGRMLGRTREGVQRVANIVQNMRGLARTSPTKLEPAALADLAATALDMVQSSLRRRNIEARVEMADLPKVACVPSQISQVVLNLLVNAIQAVEATERPEGNVIRLTTRRVPGHQVIEVADNGVGIEPEAIPKLFDPFYTTKPVGEGTGLGLSISHGIVTGHGGRIEVTSRPGEGTCFRIELPERADPAGLAQARPPMPNL
jgi:PAS domain S-box-containing protein